MSGEIKVKWYGPEVEEAVGKLLLGKLRALAHRYLRILDGFFTAPKSGRLYGSVTSLRKFALRAISGKSAARSGVHQASAPGEAPAIDTAALRKSPTYKAHIYGDEIAVSIGPSVQSGRAKIAEFLEVGTSTIQPRPAWRPAFQQLLSEGERALATDSAQLAEDET